MRHRLLGLLFVSCLLPSARAGDPKPPTIEQWSNLKWIFNPRISPNGRFVVYEVRQPEWKYGIWRTEIWTAEIANGKCRRISDDESSSGDPQWSPDGERVAFLSNRDGPPQVYAVSPTGKKGEALTNFTTGVQSFEWSPDGHWVAFIAKEPDPKDAEKKLINFGEFQVVDGDDHYRLWVTNVANAGKSGNLEARKITGEDCASIGGYRWSPDSGAIAFSASTRESADPIAGLDVYIATMPEGQIRRVAGGDGPQANPVWSPDGKDLAFESAGGQTYAFGCGRIDTVTAYGGPVMILKDGFNEDPSLISWTPQGIYLTAARRTGEVLHRLDPASKSLDTVSKTAQAYMEDPTVSADGKTMAWLGVDAAGFSEVFASSLDNFAPKQLTTIGEQLNSTRLAKREIVSWKAPDGTDIEGILIKPADFDPAKKYPLLVAIHGGPAGDSQLALHSDFPYPLEVLAAKGAVILEPNYRGSAGYGAKFRTMAIGNPGPGEASDILSGIDALSAKGFVDSDKMGVMGWSYGGYLAAWLAMSTNRFKAASVGAGLVDWRADYACSDSPAFARQFLNGTPWDLAEAYQKASPLNYLQAARTPILIQHGQFDDRVPIANAQLLYRALKDRGVATKMIVYNYMDHSPVFPGQLRSLMQHNYDWFLEYMWGEKPAETPPAK